MANIGKAIETPASVVLAYSARVKKNGNRYMVTFRDLENVFTEGESLEEAIFNAREALDGVLASMLKHGLDIPAPTATRKGEYEIPVGLEISAPLSLYLIRKQRNLTMAQVAAALGVSYQRYQSIEKPGANITAKTLQAAAAAMGAVVELKIKPVRALKAANV
ncbi:MAG: type II toxin-antitoxin system HicB family antitoxin [Gammaproteobacteria bacterium]|nr:type II toxin-antitoxin system HicB family antitoxin [Gammaproteobacteria bacterium]MBU6510195.1 type II toxin-antitoxin system HicB family antitoxin [Gammaproteobacteria bacterium]MDE2108849.1 type II toxin-antitoxin system HicB family antitoxin [Gammaproteobacteria bacterium]MDE2459622.1 type II toxin-antitoxin system HicB family antitoxin [Gammaproteobacteria bacterium]